MFVNSTIKRAFNTALFLSMLFVKNAAGMYDDLHLERKDPHVSVYEQSKSSYLKKYHFKQTELLTLIGTDRTTFTRSLQDLQQAFTKGFDKRAIRSEPKATPQKIKDCIIQIFSRKKTRNLLGISTILPEENRTIIYFYSNWPIVISHKTATNPSHPAQTTNNMIFIDYDLIKTFDEQLIRAILRLEISRTIKSFTLIRDLISQLKHKSPKPVDKTLFENKMLELYSLECAYSYIESSFDEYQALQDLISFLSPKTDVFSQSILLQITKIKEFSEQEKSFTQYYETNREPSISALDAAWSTALDKVKMEYQIAKQHVKNSEYEKAYRGFVLLTEQYKESPSRFLIKYYVKAKLKIAKLCLKETEKTPKIKFGLQALKEVASQSIFLKEKMKAGYPLFRIYLKGFFGQKQSLPTATLMFGNLTRQSIYKKTRARVFHEYGEFLINGPSPTPAALQAGLSHLNSAMDQNNCIETKIKAIKILMIQSFDLDQQNKALECAFKLCCTLFSQRENVCYFLILTKKLLEIKTLTHDKKKHKLITMLKRIYLSEQPINIKIQILLLLIMQNINIEEKRIATINAFEMIKKEFIYSRSLENMNLTLLQYLVKQTIDKEIQIQSYQILYRCLFESSSFFGEVVFHPLHLM